MGDLISYSSVNIFPECCVTVVFGVIINLKLKKNKLSTYDPRYNTLPYYKLHSKRGWKQIAYAQWPQQTRL